MFFVIIIYKKIVYFIDCYFIGVVWYSKEINYVVLYKDDYYIIVGFVGLLLKYGLLNI